MPIHSCSYQATSHLYSSLMGLLHRPSPLIIINDNSNNLRKLGGENARSNIEKDTDTDQYYCDSYFNSIVRHSGRWIILWRLFKPLIRELAILGLHCNIVNPRRLELEAAKELLAEVCGIQIREVEDLIRQKIVDFRLTGMEFGLYTSARRSYLS